MSGSSSLACDSARFKRRCTCGKPPRLPLFKNGRAASIASLSSAIAVSIFLRVCSSRIRQESMPMDAEDRASQNLESPTFQKPVEDEPVEADIPPHGGIGKRRTAHLIRSNTMYQSLAVDTGYTNRARSGLINTAETTLVCGKVNKTQGAPFAP